MSGRIGLLPRGCAVVLVLLVARVGLGCGAQLTSESRAYQLHGTVVNIVTSEPVPGALVEVLGQVHNAVFTDAGGRFHFEGLPEGSTTLVVEKPGFLGTGDYKMMNQNQLVLEVGPQGKLATVPLVPESVISGQLVDHNGAPIEGAVVRLIRADIVEGRRRWQRLPANTTSDTDGNFRFAELGSGSYCIVVNTSDVKMPFQAQIAGQKFPELFYYPGNPVSEPGTALELAAGQQAQLELLLSRARVFRISGTVTGATIARQLSVQLLDPAGDVLPFPVHFDPSGKFQISMVPAGTYLIRNETEDANGHISTSEQSISVNSDITNLQIPVVPPVSVPIDVRLEFVGNSAPRPCRMAVHGQNIDCSQFVEANVTVVLHPTRPLQMDAQSSFDPTRDSPRLRISDIDAGEYSVSVRSSLGYVASVTCNGVNLLREKLVVRPGVLVAPIEVILRDGAASISGNVRSEKPFTSASVLLAPEFAPLQPPVVVRTNSVGGFLQDGLPPGDYEVFAFDTLHDLEYANPVVLSRYASKATRVTLPANQNTSLGVSLILTKDE